MPLFVPGSSAEEIAVRYRLERVINLSSNESPMGASPKVREAVTAMADRLHRYPHDGAPRLRQVLARRLGVWPEEILVTNGSTEAIQILVDTYAIPGCEAVLPEHSFVAYARACRVAEVAVAYAAMKEYAIDLDAVAAAITPMTRFVFLANPNNPTGTVLDRQRLRDFLRNLRSNVIVVLDEAYREYAGHAVEDGLSLRLLHPRMVLLRTFSKVYGLASLRIGYAVGPPDLIGHKNSMRDPFNTNALAQAAAEAAVLDQEFMHQVVVWNAKARGQLQRMLRGIGLKPVPSRANFVLVPIGRPAGPVVEAMARRGVMIGSGTSSGLPEALRISIGLDEENRFAVRMLKEVLEEIKP